MVEVVERERIGVEERDGVAVLSIAAPEVGPPVLDEGFFAEFETILGALAEEPPHGVVIASDHPEVFLAGADLKLIGRIREGAEAEGLARRAQKVVQMLADLPCTTVAAVGGTCLGGGLELALACDRILAADRTGIRIGLPEVTLGLIPGMGGCVRLPRRIGLPRALGLILTGARIPPRKGRKLGLVDEVVPAALLLDRAREVASRPTPPRPLRMRDWIVTHTPLRGLVCHAARKRLARETHGNYPAPAEALSVVDEGLGETLDAALRREARGFGRVLESDVHRKLLGLFFLNDRLGKADPEETSRPVERIAVVGAGLMGGGLAQTAAYTGIPVRMRDIRAEALSDGMKAARKVFDRAVRKGKMTPLDADHGMRRIHPTLDLSGFDRVDLVLEAVVEDLAVKQKVFREIEGVVGPDTVLATNTSALPIERIARGVERADRLLGLHFFNPPDRMRLVEVIPHAGTDRETIATACAFVRKLGKVPVLVRDLPGFLVNRILAPYLAEAVAMREEGHPPERIDGAIERFGFVMGPLRALDTVGLDIASHVAGTLEGAFGERMRVPSLAGRLLDAGCLGRKNRRGFYRYRNGKRVRSKEAERLVPVGAAPVEDAAVVERLLFPMVNEAARCLDDEVVTDPAVLDFAMVLATGFAPFRGGPLAYADRTGLRKVVERMGLLVPSFGPRFEPAPRLADLARAGGTVHP